MGEPMQQTVRTSPGKLPLIGHTGRLALDPVAFLINTAEAAMQVFAVQQEYSTTVGRSWKAGGVEDESAVDERLAVFENRAGPRQFVLEGQVGDPLHFLGRQRSCRAPRGRSHQEPEPLA